DRFPWLLKLHEVIE
ncbi:hypothetical protein NL108_003469, partial [Boleophthalmus pectinirostris]